VAVLPDSSLDPATVTDGIANLVTRSLVAVHTTLGGTRCSLLETVRAYALEKLAESGEAWQVARRHARYFLTMPARFGTEAQPRSTFDDPERYRAEVDNLRAALYWLFPPLAAPLWVWPVPPPRRIAGPRRR
jgi:non-specific serine/threonine protein kinase